MDKLKEYFKCSRPHSFPAAIAPILIGTTFSLFYEEKFNFINFLLFFIACIFIQAATNLFNEYYDYKRGLDKVDSLGISGSIVKNKLSAKEVFSGAMFLYTVAFFIGIILSSLTSYNLLLVGILCMIVGYLYTGGKYPIAYSPFGEVFSGFFMGTVIVGIAFYIQTMYINWAVIIVSIPILLLIASILLANNIRDNENDKLSGRRTLAIILGKKKSIYFLSILIFLAQLLSLIFISLGYGSFFNLITLITIPLSLKIIKGFKINNKKETMAPFMVLTAKLTILYGISMSCSFLLTWLIL